MTNWHISLKTMRCSTRTSTAIKLTYAKTNYHFHNEHQNYKQTNDEASIFHSKRNHEPWTFNNFHEQADQYAIVTAFLPPDPDLGLYAFPYYLRRFFAKTYLTH